MQKQVLFFFITAFICGQIMAEETKRCHFCNINFYYKSGKNIETYGDEVIYACSRKECQSDKSQWKLAKIRQAESDAYFAFESSRKTSHSIYTFYQSMRPTMRRFERYLDNARKQNIPLEKQRKVIEKLLGKYNYLIVWESIVGHASLDVIKYYFPDAKPGSQLYKKAEAAIIAKYKKYEKEPSLMDMMLESAQKGSSREAKKSFLSNLSNEAAKSAKKREFTPRTKRLPLAIGLDKEAMTKTFANHNLTYDEAAKLGAVPNVRDVDHSGFESRMFIAAVCNNRGDVLQYFIKQCGGYNFLMHKELTKGLAISSAKRERLQKQLKQLKSLQANANNESKAKEYRKQVIDVQEEIAALSRRDQIYPLLYPGKFDIADFWLDYTYGYENKQSLQHIYMGSSEPYSSCSIVEEDDDTYVYAREIGPDLWKNDFAEILSYLCSIHPKLKKSADFRKKIEEQYSEYRKDSSKVKEPKNIRDPYCPAYYFNSGWKCNNIQSISRPGYVSEISDGREFCIDGIYVASGAFRPTRIYKWTPGIVHPNNPALISGKEKDIWDWVPNKYGKLGLISGKKRDEWLPAPGFKIIDGNAVWTAGEKDPQHPGLFSGKEIFTWIPDAQHLWKDEKNINSLEVQDDHQVPNLVGKILLLPVMILILVFIR